MSSCPLCRIAHPDSGVPRLLESELAVAFLDIRPIRPGHALILPRRHEPDFWNLSEQEQAEMMALARQVAAAQRALFAPIKVGLMVTGFEVPHAHLHVVPLHEAMDVTAASILNGTIAPAPAEALADQRARYAAYFQAAPAAT